MASLTDDPYNDREKLRAYLAGPAQHVAADQAEAAPLHARVREAAARLGDATMMLAEARQQSATVAEVLQKATIAWDRAFEELAKLNEVFRNGQPEGLS